MSTERKYHVLRVYEDGSGWYKVGTFKEPTLPLDAMSQGLIESNVGPTLVVISGAKWPNAGSWHDIPTEPRDSEVTK